MQFEWPWRPKLGHALLFRMDPHVIATAAKVGNVIESLLAALRPGRNGPTAKALRIIPHRSIGDPTRLTVRGRVVWQAPTNRRPLGPSGAITTREHLAALYRAFDAVELPFAQVEARVDGVRSTWLPRRMRRGTPVVIAPRCA